MDTIHKTLTDFGLTKNETVVYLEAIKHTEISPFKLAKLTGIPRTTVYDVMTSLALKGLITLKTSQGLEKQQSWIVPKNPSVLRETIFKRRKELTRLEVDVVDILLDLKKDFLPHENNAAIQFYPGKEGIKRAYELLRNIPHDVQMYYFDHMMSMDTLGKEYINKEVSQSLKNRGVKKRVKTLMHLNDWTRHVLTYQYGRNKSYIDYHEYRYIENPIFELHHDMFVFLDKVITIVGKDDELWASILTSSQVAASYVSIFQMLWQIAQPVTEKFVLSLGENEFLKEEKRKKLSDPGETCSTLR
ncbi:hypothetical protein COY90_03880 [Candidatus Roizmanbacteria bacterium CG_4_10_14_0_8_um_filter_39_9]|uniref:Transcription regulator TrmB N-terminal domain-containing protein n=1 Tax=Candidatus Roizmanbacteria bacterium CG_4_10_14_0_8_um_filter_39_9 TaxID=1974829 RepID=A0A2M7QC64_9BACT|nr:MAG: hypothetical protein COY90_03880 [Candidatus Roizmanbacteria bacterium CG_4_10_14_0_8_um_filter_39_9]